MLHGTLVLRFNVKTSCLFYDRNRRMLNALRMMRGYSLSAGLCLCMSRRSNNEYSRDGFEANIDPE